MPALIRASADATSTAADELRPAPIGDFAVYKQIRALKFVAALAKHVGNAEHVVAPRSGAGARQVVEIEFKIAGELFRVNDEFSVVAHGDCNIGREGNGGGHDESVVVVGVFANQVDAAGGAEDSGVIAESLLEVLPEFAYVDRASSRTNTHAKWILGIEEQFSF